MRVVVDTVENKVTKVTKANSGIEEQRKRDIFRYN